MSSSGESSPVPSPSRPLHFMNEDEGLREQGRGAGNSSLSPAAGQPVPRETLPGGQEPPPREASSNPAAASDPDTALPQLSSTTGAPDPERRRNFSTRPRIARVPTSQNSEYDSEEEPDPDQLGEEQTMRLIEQLQTHGNPYQRELDEARVRAQQLLRGQISNKRVASKKALSQLQSVDMNTLEESERTCVICYNEFGVPNPEGINEAPLRLPSCKHIFGDHCIKKWFEESDSCPYCRDKVHSEPALPSNAQAIREFLRSQVSQPRFAYNRVNGQRAMSSDEQLVRIMSQREERAYDNPSRGWATGERRSPPSEASDSRRRTRPRHSTFRSSSSTSTNSPRQTAHPGSAPAAPLQPSSARERVNPPNLPPHWYPFPYDQRQALTPLFPRQFPPGSSHRPYNYSGAIARPSNMPPFQSMEPLGLNPPSLSAGRLMIGFAPAPLMNSSVDGQQYPNSLDAQAGEGHLPGPAQLAAYSQQLPPVVALDGQGLSSVSDAINGPPYPSSEAWLS
ncbi:hypothetical protein B0T22DRAFT_508515 [Podospora appendiculata]|uniref:RING-type domain-containing protein n=1 Tax=Podospora appendiculata TaxID=314037 RepID=A0AAE0XLB9_9PEZI|nr:hypothetical protein B0T22DRAFT_508515 [Podospora appendiculata]